MFSEEPDIVLQRIIFFGYSWGRFRVGLGGEVNGNARRRQGSVLPVGDLASALGLLRTLTLQGSHGVLPALVNGLKVTPGPSSRSRNCRRVLELEDYSCLRCGGV